MLTSSWRGFTNYKRMHSDYVVDLCSVNDCDLLRRGEFSKDLLSQTLFSLMLHVLCNFFFLFRSTRIHTGARHNRSMMHSTISTISLCESQGWTDLHSTVFKYMLAFLFVKKYLCSVCMCVYVREWVSEWVLLYLWGPDGDFWLCEAIWPVLTRKCNNWNTKWSLS